MIDETPIWLRPLLQKTQPASAYLITGDEGAGADVLAFALAAKFSGVNDIMQHPDIMIIRPHEKKKSAQASGDDTKAEGGGAEDNNNSDDDDNKEEKAGKSKKKKNRAIYVDDARAIINFCALMPMTLEQRIVVVLQSEKMRDEAQNALLKTLEEPSAKKMFILRARHAKQLRPTVVSRCQIIKTPPPSSQQAAEWLKANGGGAEDMHYSGGLPLAIKDDGESAQQRAAIINELNKGAKANIHAVASMCAKYDDWFECLQKWAADGARIAAGASPRYFPQIKHLPAPLVKWLDLQAALVKRKVLLHHPLSADLRIRETLHVCRQTFVD